VPVLLLIAFVLAFVGALFFGLSALGPFLKSRRLHGQSASPVASLSKGTDVTVRGTVLEPRRAPAYPRLTQGPAVFSRLEVLEQVGKQFHVALRSMNAQVFRIRDDAGAIIDIDPEGAELVDGRVTSAKANATNPDVRDYVARAGSYRWQNTPATCHEEALMVGDRVTAQGRVILPLPGQMHEGDTELRMTARKLAVQVANPWASPSGRTLMRSSIVAGVSLLGTLASAVWAGFM
jgi:hypothetical protein